jgi:membrane-associated phospholipid phosphatase
MRIRPAFALALAAAAIGAANLALQGPLPGDVGVTRALQGLLGAEPAWATWLTGTAKAPLLWVTLLIAAVLAGWGASRSNRWERMAAVPLAYGLAFVADKGLRAILFAPRPDAALVAVADPAASSGLPSTFGLVYGAMFGVALLARGDRRGRVIAGALLAAGLCARIVLGGHWPSQMLASAALGLLLALAAMAVIGRVRGK